MKLANIKTMKFKTPMITQTISKMNKNLNN